MDVAQNKWKDALYFRFLYIITLGVAGDFAPLKPRIQNRPQNGIKFSHVQAKNTV